MASFQSPLSLPDRASRYIRRSEMPTMLATTQLLKFSHMEILYEIVKAEPRLGRLLGHISIWDNVERWRTKNEEKISCVEDQMKCKKVQLTPNSALVYQNSKHQAHSIPKIHTLAESQAAIQAQMKFDRQATVISEEMFSESDSEDEFDSEETLGNESDDDST